MRKSEAFAFAEYCAGNYRKYDDYWVFIYKPDKPENRRTTEEIYQLWRKVSKIKQF